jgi:hypothetical protein
MCLALLCSAGICRRAERLCHAAAAGNRRGAGGKLFMGFVTASDDERNGGGGCIKAGDNKDMF